jgi:DNA-binding response OmpR family regulator
LEFKGFAVDWLADPHKALTRILMYRDEYELILLDLSLQGMDGSVLTQELRAEGIKTPIIILTGRGETEYKIALLNSGADDYVVKPFSSDELIARINSVLRRPAVSLPVVYNVGAIEINMTTRSVKARGQEVPLTLKEFGLLECFVRRPNEVLTREELCNQVWDFNALTMSNVLDVHMKNLRKKLPADEVRLETVRGVGYRFVA